jgi:hypothetical protein
MSIQGGGGRKKGLPIFTFFENIYMIEGLNSPLKLNNVKPHTIFIQYFALKK